MTTLALALFPDGEIRELEIDLDRPDVICGVLDTPEYVRIDVDDRYGMLIDRYSTRDVAPVNVYATLVLLSAQPTTWGISGPALLFGRTLDGDLDDVPDSLVEILRGISEGLSTT